MPQAPLATNEFDRLCALWECEILAPELDAAFDGQNDWFKVLANCLPHLTWTCLPDGHCDYLSQQWLSYTGIPQESQLGYGWLEQLHLDDRTPTTERWQKHVASGLPFCTQFRIRGSDGDYRWFQTHAVPIRDPHGRIVKWLGSNTDIQAIRTSEERYELAVQLAARSSRDGLWDWDILTDEIYYAPRFKELLGYTDDEFPNVISSFLDVLHPEDHEAVREAVEFHFAQPQVPYDIEYRLRTKSGDYRFFHAHGVSLQNQKGEPSRMVGSIVDISDRIRAEGEMRATSELLRQFIAHTPAAVAMLDKNMCYLQASERWLHDYKIGHDVVGRSHYEVFPDIPDRWKEIHQRVLAGATEACDEDPFDRSDGTTEWLQWEARPWRDAKNEIGGLILFTQVITQRKKIEDELIAARETAEAANRAKSDFLANMSHEIRTPLTSILGYADLLTDHDLTNTERAAHAAAIKRSGEHLLTIINDILDLSKIEAGKMTVERIEFSPADIVAEVLRYFQEGALAKNLTLTAEGTSPIPITIYSDPVRVRQILVNLVGNAVKFTERGGIKVVMRVVVEAQNQSSKLAFDVCDTGIGISDEQRALLFAPFVQADTSITRKFGGTGLGLTICRRMAQLLDGDISVVSVPGEGSTFTATVDTGSLAKIGFTDVFVEPEPVAVAPSANTRLSGWILLAEDSLVNQHLIRTLLTKAGANIDVVENGELAVERALAGPNRGDAQSTGPSIETYDLVLMDMQMPVLDGCSAARKLRDRGFTSPIVAVTANAMAEDRLRCFAAGCNDFVTKPIDFSHLLEVCRNWMSNHRLATRAIEERREMPVAVPPINAAALYRLVDNDLALLENVVRLCLDDSSALMERARDALAAGDLPQVAGAAHRLKGTVGVVQAESAFQAARSLEALAYGEDLQGVQDQLAELQRELDRLSPSLMSLISSQQT